MDILSEFETKNSPRIVYGCGSLSKIPELVKEFGTRAMIVTDAGISKAGYPQILKEKLSKAGFEVDIFSDSKENPTESDAQACALHAEKFCPDFLIGLGGGSSMDTAKGCNFIYTNGGKMEDYHGYGKASKPMLPLICVPTTSGTGSECQSFALISRDADHKKMACGDTKNLAAFAVLDPELTTSQPQSVTANTGMDALAHAVETYVSLKATPYSRIYSAEAFRLLALALPKVLRESETLDARGAMLLGAAYAGKAIENSMLGAAHGCANPLTAGFNVIHGQAVGVMLPAVIRRNSQDPQIEQDYADLLSSVSFDPDCQAESLDELIENMLKLAAMPLRLNQFGVNDSHIGKMAEDAEGQWTSSFNPVALTFRDFTEIFGAVL